MRQKGKDLWKSLFEKKVDERQEMELRKIESHSFWALYWMLLAAILIQGIFLENGAEKVVGEWIVFMLGSVYMLIGCVRKGVWSYQTRRVPGVKYYLKYSLFTMLIVGIPFGLLVGLRGETRDLQHILVCVLLYMVNVFVLAFALFCITGGLARRSERKREEQALAEDEMSEDEM